MWLLSITGKDKSELESPFWDVIVLTTADHDQKSVFEEQVRQKLQRKELPLGIPIYVVADPPGPKLGTCIQLTLSAPLSQIGLINLIRCLNLFFFFYYLIKLETCFLFALVHSIIPFEPHHEKTCLWVCDQVRL